MCRLPVIVLALLLSGCGVTLSWDGGYAGPEVSTDLWWDQVVYAGDLFEVSAYDYDGYVDRLRVSFDGYEVADYHYYGTYDVREYVRVPYLSGEALVRIEAWDSDYNLSTQTVRVYVWP